MGIPSEMLFLQEFKRQRGRSIVWDKMRSDTFQKGSVLLFLYNDEMFGAPKYTALTRFASAKTHWYSIKRMTVQEFNLKVGSIQGGP